MTDPVRFELPATLSPFRAALGFSRSCHEFIWSQLVGANFISSPRNDLVLAYGAITLEHHLSILTLYNAGLCGSALALLRPQVETVFRCLWVIKLASEQQVEAIGESGLEPFPKFRDMAAVLDESYQTDGYFAAIATQWSTFNGYTHSGLEQLGRRFRDDGNVGSNYAADEMAAVLEFSSSLSLALFVPIFKSSGLPERGMALEEWAANSRMH